MTDNNSTSDDALTIRVESYGSPQPKPSYDVAPEDAHYVQKIQAVDVNDIRGPHEYPDHWSVPSLRVTTLPKELQGEVSRQLAALPPAEQEAKERGLVAAAIRKYVTPMVRVQGGLHESATPYHREINAINREMVDMEREIAALDERMLEIARYETKFDPATGKPEAVPVMALHGERLEGAIAHRKALMHQVKTLWRDDGTAGPIAQRRAKQALFETVQQMKQLDEQKVDRATAKTRAAAMIREERINKQATSLANMQRSPV